MQKIMAWAKSHKLAATGIGCGGLLVAGFLLIVIIGVIVTLVNGPSAPEDAEPAAETATTEATSEAPSSAPPEKPATTAPPKTSAPTQVPSDPAPTSPAPKSEAPAAEDSFAAKLEKTVLDAAGVDKFSDMTPESPVYAVTKVEDVSTGTARVYVQDTLTDDQADDVARWFMNMGCGADDSLEINTIVVRDVSGVDRNHFTAMMDPITLCG
ncbi:hypothetical protein [Brevibacterium sp.]|uniref:hypothetical protein n=1 Tax=Brevibacterium sp. TaxID=1701 RepID=UPI002810FA14|nr:hypothetical protein [Brevibacterium sp.]